MPRPIYSYFSEKIGSTVNIDHLKVTERSKELFKQGDPGQGFAYFLDLETGEIDLIPAFNKNDGRERKEFIYEGKNYAVVSDDELGKSSGSVHTKGLALVKKNGPEKNRSIVAGGVFMGDDYLLRDFRNKSASKNMLAISYNPAYLVSMYAPAAEKHNNPSLVIQRSIPADITHAIKTALLEQLPFRNGTDNQIKGVESELDPEGLRKKLLAAKPELEEQLPTDLSDIAELSNNEKHFQDLSESELTSILETNVFVAAIHNDADIVKKFLSIEGTPIENKKKLIEDFTRPAVDYKQIYKEVFSHLDINKIVYQSYRETPLMYAIRNNNLTVVEALLEIEKIEVNNRNAFLKSPMDLAVEMNRGDILKALLRHKGIDVNVKNIVGETYLFAAAAKGNMDAVKVLLEAGADPSIARIDEKKPADIARQSGHHDLADLIDNFGKKLSPSTESLKVDAAVSDSKINDNIAAADSTAALNNRMKTAFAIGSRRDRTPQTDKAPPVSNTGTRIRRDITIGGRGETETERFTRIKQNARLKHDSLFKSEEKRNDKESTIKQEPPSGKKMK